ncbi:hypothetical protein BsWGS_11661 [Bradybaena similaris]
MSNSKKTRMSAYQMYSQQTRSSRPSHSSSSDGSHDNHVKKSADVKWDKRSGSTSSRDVHLHRERSYDSDDEVLKGYVPSSFSSSKDKRRALESSARKDDVRKKRSDDRKPSARSLMDIDFSKGHGETSRSSLSRWKDHTSHHDFSSEEESRGHGDMQNDWKGERRFSKYSDSEDDGDMWHSTSRSRRTWKNSSPLAHHSEYNSQPTGRLEMTERLHNKGHKRSSGDNPPKPLLETYIPPPGKKPISLFDLPEGGGRNDSRFHRKLAPRKDFSSSSRRKPFDDNATESERKIDHSSRTSSRKHSDTVDRREPPVKKSKTVKSKNEARDKLAIMTANKITVCKSTGQTFLVIPSALTTLHLHGRGRITVLLGSINILGCKLRNSSYYDVYSPASGSLLAIQVADETKFKASDVKEELSKFSIPENDESFESIGNNTIAVMMVERLESALCDYITSFIPYTQLFTAVPTRDIEASELKGVTLPKLGIKVSPYKEMAPVCMNVSQDYEDVCTKWATLLSDSAEANKAPVVLCTGAKNTGKSTVNRMLVNTALKSVSAVAYLDCDVGQTEFSPPATLSLHVIKQPVLEPPFCHQRHAEKMVFYGETTPNYDPDVYMQCLKFIVDAYYELTPQLPLIVNTMGFLEGVGLLLLMDTMHMLKPDLVVQIESFNPASNLPPITPEFVALEEGWIYNKTSDNNIKDEIEEERPHEVVLLPTLVSQKRDFSFKLKPVDLRNLTLLSALSVNLERGMGLTSLPPYAVPYRQFGVSICHHKLTGKEVLTAIDASVVALCVADLSKAERVSEDLPLVFAEMPVCDCLGLGIVRGIDTDKGLLYLVSTLPRVHLQMMNTILKGSLSLPDQILLKQTSSGPIPYVDALAPSTAVASVKPRSRMPRTTLGASK